MSGREVTLLQIKALELANNSLKNDFGKRRPNMSKDKETREKSRIEGTKEWAVCAAAGIMTGAISSDEDCQKIIDAIENN